MIREYLLEGLKVVTIILMLATLTSALFFTRNGLVTRKTLIVMFIGFLLFVISALATSVLLYMPSRSEILLSILCLGGLITIFGVFWAFKYYSLPYIEKKIEKKINKKD